MRKELKKLMAAVISTVIVITSAIPAFAEDTVYEHMAAGVSGSGAENEINQGQGPWFQLDGSTFIIFSGVGTISGRDMALDIKGGSTANNANAQIYTMNLTQAQEFRFEAVRGHYRIVNVKSGKVLDVSG